METRVEKNTKVKYYDYLVKMFKDEQDRYGFVSVIRIIYGFICHT